VADNNLVIPPPTPKLLDYPASMGLSIAVILTIVLVIVAGRFDKTGGTLTVSILVILAFISLVTFCVYFTVPTDEITSGAIGGLVAAFGAVVAYWLSRTPRGPPE
jgi:uncharacterized BrkB/YihY/UPF0761 family membrane protein